MVLLLEFWWKLLSLVEKTLGIGYCLTEYLHDLVRNAVAAAVAVVAVVGQNYGASVDHSWSFLWLYRRLVDVNEEME